MDARLVTWWKFTVDDVIIAEDEGPKHAFCLAAGICTRAWRSEEDVDVAPTEDGGGGVIAAFLGVGSSVPLLSEDDDDELLLSVFCLFLDLIRCCFLRVNRGCFSHLCLDKSEDDWHV